MRTRMYREVSLDEMRDADSSELESRLAKTLNTVSTAITLLWTRGLTVQIASIQVRDLSAGGGWREVLTQRWMDDDGEFSHPLGLFRPGTTLQVMIVAMAMDADVPRAAAAVSMQPGGRVTQIIPAPPAPFDTMQRGMSWVREGKVTV